MRRVSAVEARSSIAHLILGASAVGSSMGEVTLHPHQVEAVRRIEVLLAESGGALLADDVGLGKTYAALAVAKARRAQVIAPAGICDAWRAAADATGVSVEILSVESLSRTRASRRADSDLVIIDEAHHLRNAETRRFAAARELCRAARVLLLSATPVQNSERDLRVVLSLFLGELAHALPPEALARYVIRRTAPDLPTDGLLRMPTVEPPVWMAPVADEDCLDRILALPPPLPPRGGGDPGALLAYSLVRQWASSRAALLAALRRRLARGLSMADALRTGRLPSVHELAAWAFADGAQQLSFPELVVPATDVGDAAALILQVEHHMEGVRDLLDWLRATPDPDVCRASRIRDILRNHPNSRVVAFSEHTATVAALYSHLVGRERAALMTHSGGRVAGGPMSRRDLLARFAPATSAGRPEAERIDLLLTTDVLSEGVGLHDANVVVHLDLTWNPARLSQRVGRVRRMGATHERAHVYLMPPPVPADRLLRMEERLRWKLSDAARTVGIAGQIIPGAATGSQRSAAEREQRIASVLRSWQRASPPSPPVVGAVRVSRAAAAGALVVLRDDDHRSLLACVGTCITDARDAVASIVEAAGGDDAGTVPAGAVEALAKRVNQWIARHRLGDVVDISALRVARSRRALLHRVDGISRRTPRHAQPRLAPLVQAVRATATATLSAGAERVLDELAHAPLADEAWLHAVGQFAELHARGRRGEVQLEAALLLIPGRTRYSPRAGSNSSRVGEVSS